MREGSSRLPSPGCSTPTARRLRLTYLMRGTIRGHQGGDPTYLWREVIREAIKEVIKEAIRRTCGGLSDHRARARASAPLPPQGKRPD